MRKKVRKRGKVMKANLTRKNIEEYVPKTLFKGKCENYQLLHVMSEIEELTGVKRATLYRHLKK